MKNRILNYVLRPSTIEGVGVFTTRAIKKGEYIHIFDYSERDMVIIKEKTANKDPELLMMCERYGVLTKKGYYCPKRFNHMYIGWYINHSKTPNIGPDTERISNFYKAIRDIDADEELFLDYSLLDHDIDNSIL